MLHTVVQKIYARKGASPYAAGRFISPRMVSSHPTFISYVDRAQSPFIEVNLEVDRLSCPMMPYLDQSRYLLMDHNWKHYKHSTTIMHWG